MRVNRKYKDSVFSFLFRNQDSLRELYGAIKGIELPPDTPLTINTLEGVLYRTFVNDISFDLAKKLVILIEHQSSINPNMALRLLMYISRVYEKIIPGRSLYSRKRLIIPRPEFIVLYNGVEPYPDEAVLKLSDAFEEAESLGISAEMLPDLELRVKVYNINQGRSQAVLRRSAQLSEYSEFVARVRDFEGRAAGGRKPPLKLSGRERKKAMKDAIQWCLAHNILKSFLETHGSEVVNMLMSEWKLEDALAVEREEAREEGLEKGRLEVARNALTEGASIEFVQKISGLDIETIKSLAKR
ncbi:MAG: Rpn family recombination-promoting nuclease/putative transposase [Spirochaetales bacterium]|jgi:predicted transposase/invertase (TIGR01784 family)|nr:Rpn family recombination-promoting nuclease/putative transposase [Spirochaetales bacterium]